MKTVIDNQFVLISVSEELSMVKSEWKPASERMTDDEFKELGLLMLETITKYSLKRLLSDTRDFLYIITPEIQTWFGGTVIVPCSMHSLKTVAYVISSDLFSRLSVEQLMEENPELGITTKYFDDEQQAIDWVSES